MTDSNVQDGRAVTRPKLIRRVSLHSVLISDLRDMIERGELRAGLPIVETDLCAQFGVSRTPLREALKILASDGLVQLRPHRTPMVSAIDPKEIASIFETVAGLERMAAKLGCERATDEQIAGLEDLHKQMIAVHEVDDGRSYTILNRDVHTRIVRLADNPVLLSTHASLTSKIARARQTLVYNARRWRESPEEHEAIMQAFRDRDPTAAADAMELHAIKTGAAVVANLIEQQRSYARGGY